MAIGMDKAILSHESALALLELSDNVPDGVHLLVARRHRGLRRPAGVVLHTSPDDEQIATVWRDGMPLTASARTLVDVADEIQPEQAAMAAEQALRLGLLTRRQLEREAARRGKTRALATLVPDRAERGARSDPNADARPRLVTMRPISESAIREAAERLGRAARKPARVILFGSYARGMADADSDLDFLVVQEDGFGRRREIVRLREALSPLRVPAEVLVVSHEEAAEPERAGDAVRDALAEGVVLYDSA